MDNRETYLLSHVIGEDSPLYGGEQSISLKRAKSIQKGDSCNTMRWSFPNHTGTHVDVPFHFAEDGASVTEVKPENWIFNKVLLTEISGVKPGYIVEEEDLGDIKDCELFLIKTNFEKYRTDKVYWKNSPGLHPDIAPWLKEKCPSIRAIGVDFISISNLNKRNLGRDAHRSFLENNILIVEDMKLSEALKAPGKVIIAPLLAEEADGSPCTVFAMKE